MRLPKTLIVVNETVRRTAAKHGVKIYQFANVGNHLHLLIKIPSVRQWAAFIRELSGRIAQQVMELVDSASIEKFWRFRPYTRIVRSWKKAYKSVKDYVYLNQVEAEGHISRKEISSLSQLKMIWADTA